MNTKPIIFQTQQELEEWAYQTPNSDRSLFTCPPNLADVFPKILEKYKIPYSLSVEKTENKGTTVKLSSFFDDLSFVEVQKTFYKLTGLDYTDLTYKKIKNLLDFEDSESEKVSTTTKRKPRKPKKDKYVKETVTEYGDYETKKELDDFVRKDI